MQDDANPAAQIARLVNGYQVSQAIHVAVTLGIADHLAAGSRSSDELAAATGSHAPTLYRLLRALARVDDWGTVRQFGQFARWTQGDELFSRW